MANQSILAERPELLGNSLFHHGPLLSINPPLPPSLFSNPPLPLILSLNPPLLRPHSNTTIPNAILLHSMLPTTNPEPFSTFNPVLYILPLQHYGTDWMILSEATSAVFTAESTFGGSARARKGYFGARWDYHVINQPQQQGLDKNKGLDKDKEKGSEMGLKKKQEDSPNVLQCQLVNSFLEICESCKKLKKMCPIDVVTECEVLGVK